MATSVRIRVGLREFQLESDSRTHVGEGDVLPVHEALRTLAAVRDPATRAMIRLAACSVGARGFEWDEDLQLRGHSFTRRSAADWFTRSSAADWFAALLESGRLRVRAIDAVSLRALGGEKLELEPEREENEITESHSVMIELIDAEGNPVPGEPFRIMLPDGTVRTLRLDEQGKSHITGIERAGTCQVCFFERDASIWAPA
jgi:hypothetical protein